MSPAEYMHASRARAEWLQQERRERARLARGIGMACAAGTWGGGPDLMDDVYREIAGEEPPREPDLPALLPGNEQYLEESKERARVERLKRLGGIEE